jgi:phage terminase large subunit-like protein
MELRKWLAAAARQLPEPVLMRFLSALGPGERLALDELWPLWRLRAQEEPESDWRVWLIMAGRGFGKTRAGAEWTSGIARAHPGARIALVAASFEEGVQVMVKGESGLMAVARMGEAPEWRAASGTLRFRSGATAQIYSAEKPDRLRGPEHHFAWCDELAKWRLAEEAWDHLILGLRLGDRPRAVVTTTPRPVAALRTIVGLDRTRVTRGRTIENPYLPDDFKAAVTGIYSGTRLGRQELDGELFEDVEGALWTDELIERSRVGPFASLSPLARIVIGVDPPASAEGDACGIVACGIGEDGIGYVLGDHSVSGLSPQGWAARVAAAAEAWQADRVVAETNNGGEMVETVLRGASINLPVKRVHASDRKTARAEPVAALFESGRARFAGGFPDLERELCGLTTGGGYCGPGRSPDRADAMVWAMTELMLGRARAEPRIIPL